MNATEETSEYYTYEKAAQVLGISYGHLARAISQYGVFHPVHAGKGMRKHLLKSEVDARVGEQLFTQRKPKKIKQKGSLLQGELGTHIDVEALVRAESARITTSFAELLAQFIGPSGSEAVKAWKEKVESEGIRLVASSFR